MLVVLRRAFVAASLGLGFASLDSLRAESVAIAPGPTTISKEETAILADPAVGVDGAVILVDESDRNDASDRGGCRFSRHIRAKILSDDGRSLAELHVVLGASGRVVTFWGRTISPGGHVSELRREGLRISDRLTGTLQQTGLGSTGELKFARNFAIELSVLQGTLPDVVPGSVIDYGWTVESGSFEPYSRTPLQGKFPVRKLRHRWVSSLGFQRGVRIPNDPAHRVHVEEKAGAVLITAENLPAESGEPLGPLPSAYLASEVIYYLPPGQRVNDFWESIGAETERHGAAFVGNARDLPRLLESAGLSTTQDFDDKLRRVRSWLIANLPRRDQRRTETFPKNLADALRLHDASIDQRNFALAAIARSLGAEVETVRVRNRAEGPWRPEILSIAELDNVMLRARRPGASDEEAVWIDTEPDLPYGSLEPEAQGARGIAVTPAGTRSIELPISPSSANLANTTVTISPAALGGGSARWVTTSRGGQALTLRRQLRHATVEKRPAMTREWCSGDTEQTVISAEVSGEDDAELPLELRCGVGLRDVRGAESAPVLAISVEGPWLAKLPVLPVGPRRLPVILPYTSRESSVIDVIAPDGRVAGDTPAGVRLSSRFGKYELTLERHGDGFRVARNLAMDVIEVQPSEYVTFRDFLDDVREADGILLPFVRAQ